MQERPWRGGREPIDFARSLRKNPTDAERRLWSVLRCRQLLGRRFRRQYPVAGYVLDFVSLEDKLVVEVDGSQHQDSVRDHKRDEELERLGFRVVRFWNNEVLTELPAVVSVLEEILRNPLPNPPPLRRGGDLPSGASRSL